MTVSELIAKLQTLPGDALVLTEGSPRSRLVRVSPNVFRQVTILLENGEDSLYYVEHPQGVPAVLL